MFPNDPTLYGATLPQRDFSFANPYFAPWNQQFPLTNYGQQFPLPTYAQPFPLPTYAQQFPLPTYGQQFPLQAYPPQIPLHYGQQIPWSFNQRVPQPFMQSEFVPPMLPFQGPIQGKGYFNQVPYLPYPQNSMNLPQFNLPQVKMPLPYGY